MKKEKIFKILFWAISFSFMGIGLTSCGDDDVIGQEGETDIVDNTSPIENGTDDNPLVGSWYETTIVDAHRLYKFNEDETFTYWYRSDEVFRKEEGTYSYDGGVILYLTYTDGETVECRVSQLTKTELSFKRGDLSYNLKASSLTGLDEGCKPLPIEQAVNVWFDYGETGGVSFFIVPHYGVDHYYYSLEATANENNGRRGKGALSKKYSDNDLEFGTDYKFSVTAYDVQGNAYRTYTYPFTTKGYKGMVNYVVYEGEYYDLEYAQMSQKHDISTGTGTGTNFKFLDLYYGDNGLVRFTYAVHEWEGIDKEWMEGTYNIKDNSSYHSYSALFIKEGKSQQPGGGKLVIKRTSNNYYTFDFELELAAGHFEGNLVE